MNIFICYLHLVPAPQAVTYLTTTSLIKKYVKNIIINGSNTNIQEIDLNPLEHNQFNTHAQMTRNTASVRSVQMP